MPTFFSDGIYDTNWYILLKKETLGLNSDWDNKRCKIKEMMFFLQNMQKTQKNHIKRFGIQLHKATKNKSKNEVDRAR